jgi:hypothetical protein
MIYLTCYLYFSMPVIDFSIYFNFISIVFSFFVNYATEANLELYYFSLAMTLSPIAFDFSIYFFDYSLSFSNVCFYLFVCSTTASFSFFSFYNYYLLFFISFIFSAIDLSSTSIYASLALLSRIS